MEQKGLFLFVLLAIALLSLGIFAQSSPTMTATVPVLANWTASSNPISYGNTQALTAVLAAGTGPFTYNFSIYNASGVLETSAFLPNISAVTSSFTFQQLPAWNFGIFTANITIQDGAFPNSIIYNSLTYLVQSTTTTTSTTTASSVSSAYSSTLTSVSSISASTSSVSSSATSSSTTNSTSSTPTTIQNITNSQTIAGNITVTNGRGSAVINSNGVKKIGIRLSQGSTFKAIGVKFMQGSDIN